MFTVKDKTQTEKKYVQITYLRKDFVLVHSGYYNKVP